MKGSDLFSVIRGDVFAFALKRQISRFFVPDQAKGDYKGGARQYACVFYTAQG